MKYNLPVTIGELVGLDCADLQHRYLMLSRKQRKSWLKVAAAANIVRLQKPIGGDSVQINMYDPNTQSCDGLTCHWEDDDLFATSDI